MNNFIFGLIILITGSISHAEVSSVCHDGMQHISIIGKPAEDMFNQMKVSGFDNGAAIIKQSVEIESASCVKAYKYTQSYDCNIDLASAICDEP